MEPDEIKAAWQHLGQRLERHESLQYQLLREARLDRLRHSLRPLFWGQALQLLLGVGVLVLGVACWTRNTDVPGLLATGLVLHAFGLLTTIMAALTMVMVARLDYTAPVVSIQKSFGRLRRFHLVNATVCGVPWWIMWVLVVVGFAGLGDVDPAAGTPAWVAGSLVVGVAGWLATTLAMYRASRDPDMQGRSVLGQEIPSLRRGHRLLEEVERFERE